MIYAFIQKSIVTLIEKRLAALPYEDSLTPLVNAKLYANGLIPFFKPVPPELENKVRNGWLWSDELGFHEPQPFEINQDTGELYLPASIPAADFWQVFQENVEIKNQAQLMQGDLIQQGQMVTDLELASIENGQSMTDLELSLYAAKEGIAGV